MCHGEIGLAGTGRADAEHHLEAVHGADIAILSRVARDDRGLARGDLGHAHLAALFERGERKLAVF